MAILDESREVKNANDGANLLDLARQEFQSMEAKGQNPRNTVLSYEVSGTIVEISYYDTKTSRQNY